VKLQIRNSLTQQNVIVFFFLHLLDSYLCLNILLEIWLHINNFGHHKKPHTSQHANKENEPQKKLIFWKECAVHTRFGSTECHVVVSFLPMTCLAAPPSQRLTAYTSLQPLPIVSWMPIQGTKRKGCQVGC